MSELLDGGTLGQLLTRGPLPVRKAIDYGVQIARGLAAAHEKGIVHRDLKPDNIFVTKDGRVKILDFGLAKLTEAKAAPADGPTVTLPERTEPGAVLGTVGYMSPEQVRGKTADHRADIFAFGAILYEMLTGKRAFRKPTSTETMTAILNEDPPGISQIVPGTPPALLRIVHRCLEKNPEQRFQSASDLAFALEALSDSGSSSVAAISQGSALALDVDGSNSGCGRTCCCAHRMVENPACRSGGGVGHATHRRWRTKGRQNRKRWCRGFISTKDRRGAGLSHKSPSAADVRCTINTRLVNPQLVALAPDGSQLLALVGGLDLLTSPMWSIPLPAGEPRRVGSVEAEAADIFPDGRIVFADTKELFVTEKDGSNTKSCSPTVRAPGIPPSHRTAGELPLPP